MKLVIAILLFLLATPSSVFADIHIVFYATYKGATGHCGIAIDEYKILIRDEIKSGKVTYVKDTVRTGLVRYFDFWPFNENYKGNYKRDVDPAYYMLPNRKWKSLISVKTLADQGVPHKYDRPCDGILTLATTVKADLELMQYLQKKMDAGIAFNAIRNNCCDFVIDAIRFVFGTKIDARENVVQGVASTPNRLYQELVQWSDCRITKDPQHRVDGSFIEQRILYALVPPFLNL